MLGAVFQTFQKQLSFPLLMQKFIAVIIPFLFLSCGKEAVQPGVTTSGENTFSFRFNDTLFVPNVGMISNYSKYFAGPRYVTTAGRFQVGADNRSDFGNFSVDLFIKMLSLSSL
jgi:hypothetical protein